MNPKAPANRSEKCPPVSVAENLSVRYLTTGPAGDNSWVLDRVNLAIYPGQITAVTGPSGCGKSTLVKVLCGLIPHSIPSEYRGSVRLGGVEVADAPVEHIATYAGYVGQSPDASVVTDRIFDEVAFALQNLGLSRTEIAIRVREVLAEVGLLGRLWEDPRKLSGGGRQRLALAAALATHPKMLVLDEPTSNIDEDGSKQIYDLVVNAASKGVGALIIDHNLDLFLDHIDNLVVLNGEGALVASGPPQAVFAEHLEYLRELGVWLPRSLRLGEEHEKIQRMRAQLAATRQGKDTEYYTRVGGLWRRGWRCLENSPKIKTVAKPELKPQTEKQSGESLSASTRKTIDTATIAAAPTLRVEDLTVPYRCPPISMKLSGGELVAIVGANGAGKTSFLAALSGILRFQAKTAEIGGKALKKGVHLAGYVFQNPQHQMVTATVEKELTITGISTTETEQLLTDFHLQTQRKRHPMTLSGGQARRLSVATVVAEERQLIVLDEPTYGQDWDNTTEMLGFFQDLQSRGHSVIIATHDLDLALAHATHIVHLPAPNIALGSGKNETRLPCTDKNERQTLETAPAQERGIFAGLNPLTVFLGVIPLCVAIVVAGNPMLNITVMGLVTLLLCCTGANWTKILGTTIIMWSVLLAISLIFQLGWRDRMEISLYDYGDAFSTASLIGALLSLFLFSGFIVDPHRLIVTITTTFKVPYRIAAVGISAIAFIQVFRENSHILAVARKLRGIGVQWRILAPAVRWVSCVIPMLIIAVQHAEQVALSMDSRAFGAYAKRTELQDVPWQKIDWALLVALWGVGALIFMWR